MKLLDIVLKNWQGYSDADIELDPGINVITGESNSGKSSVLRAIRWILTNRPKGSGFIKRGAQSAKAVVTIDNGHDTPDGIVRIKGKKKNKYTIFLAEENKKYEYEAVGDSVPSELPNILNLTEVNVQDQFSPYFLVFDSPGKIGEIFNRTTGLQELTTAIQIASSRLLEIRRGLNAVETEKDKLQCQRKELEKKYKPLYDKAKKLKKKIPKLLDASHKLMVEAQNIEELCRRVKDINNLLERVDVDNANLLVKSIIDLEKELKALKKEKDSIENLIEQIEEYDEEILEATKDRKTYEKKLNDIMAKLDICPLCGRPMK